MELGTRSACSLDAIKAATTDTSVSSPARIIAPTAKSARPPRSRHARKASLFTVAPRQLRLTCSCDDASFKLALNQCSHCTRHPYPGLVSKSGTETQQDSC